MIHVWHWFLPMLDEADQGDRGHRQLRPEPHRLRPAMLADSTSRIGSRRDGAQRP